MTWTSCLVKSWFLFRHTLYFQVSISLTIILSQSWTRNNWLPFCKSSEKMENTQKIKQLIQFYVYMIWIPTLLIHFESSANQNAVEKRNYISVILVLTWRHSAQLMISIWEILEASEFHLMCKKQNTYPGGMGNVIGIIRRIIFRKEWDIIDAFDTGVVD